MKVKNKKLLLIDGNALVHRAFHALPPLTSPSGKVVNAVFGFSSLLLRSIKELKPDYIAAAFDLAGPTFRHEEYSEYKAKRTKAPQELYDQIPLVKEVLDAFGVPIYEMEGFEADDLIGTLAYSAKKTKGVNVVIATGDLDTLQLVDGKKVTVFTMKRGVNDTVLYDEKAVKERYGLKPSQLNDYRGLKGDPSDNIPGVSGVGEKTATALIAAHKDLDGLYKALESGKVQVSEKLKAKLQEEKEQAYFSKQLSIIVTDLDVEYSLEKVDWRKNLDVKKIESLFAGHGFRSLTKRLDDIGLGAQVSMEMAFENSENQDKGADVTDIDRMNEEDLEKIFDTDKSIAIYVVDERIYFSLDGKTVYSVSCETLVKNNLIQHKFYSAEILSHEIKSFIHLLLKAKMNVCESYFDTSVAAYMLNIGRPNIEIQDLYKLVKEGEEVNPVAANRPLYVFEIASILKEKLLKAPVRSAFENIELPLLPVLAKMESKGIRVDVSVISQLLTHVSKELDKLQSNIYRLAGKEFNISSPSQLATVLYDDLGITGKIKKTSGGARSTAVSELEKIRDGHEIVDLIMKFREYSKLKSTYIAPFPALIKSGKVHTTYNQMGTATGRISSQDPNLQNIPIRTELGRKFRKAFVPRKGTKLVAFDYSQIELRIAAHIAKDKKMIAAFKGGEDIHTRTAAEVFDVPAKDVTTDMRRTAKVLNFGILYGMGVLGFARAAKVSRNEARQFMDAYFNEFSGIAEYMEATKVQVAKTGYVETLFGHRRILPDIRSTMPQLRSAAERMAINMPIQGTQADIIKMAMIEIDKYLEQNDKNEGTQMLLQIHDELVFEVDSKHIDSIVPHIRKIMEEIYTLNVPIVVDVKTGDNWQDMKTWEK